MPWIDNVFVSEDHSLLTVYPDGTLEIRGPNWDRRKRKGETKNTDCPRICKFDNETQARYIVELIDKLYGTNRAFKRNIKG